MDILQSVLDADAQAIFTVDRQGVISHINTKAKDRFDLTIHGEGSHGAGRLEKGDLVILADTSIGADDGGLTPGDLERLGISERRIHTGDMLVAAGVYEEVGPKPVYKWIRSGDRAQLQMDTVFWGIPIHVQVGDHTASVTVEGTTYSMSYFLCIGQMVVIDHRSRTVKFWQMRGYTVRKESIAALLRGGSYRAKSPGREINVVGHLYTDYFRGAHFERDISAVLSGAAETFVDQEYDINGYAIVASLVPLRDGDTVDGIMVRFRNVQEMKDAIMERNAAIRSAERHYREVENSVGFGADDNAFSSLFGNSTAMVSAKRYAYKLARLHCNILITGEQGTGKSYLARTIASCQPQGSPFLSADCSAIAASAMESTLFGYGDTPGLFEKAHGGTLFLDEIGETSLRLQGYLVNTLQTQTVRRIGSLEERPVDVRLIASSRRDLMELVNAGQFRADLYYRLSTFSLELPPLRSCREELPLIINNLLDGIRQKYHMPEKYLSGEVFSRLLAYDWPGNIRELENVLERAAVLSETEIIYPEHIQLASTPRQLTMREQLKAEEKRILQQTLAQCGGDRKRAMEQLGLSRSVFYDKLKEHGLS